MKQCPSDLRDEICLPYLDDVIIFSKAFEQHVEDVRKVLRRLRENGIKVISSKCALFKKQVKFLGWIGSGDGYTVDPNNTKAVTSLKVKTPTTVGWTATRTFGRGGKSIGPRDHWSQKIFWLPERKDQT